jgi:CMP-2-keto-3-deoxyoctulosonic acid synthetase
MPRRRHIAIIPCRYGSSRLPGKPLALLAGKPLISCNDTSPLGYLAVRTAEAVGADTVYLMGREGPDEPDRPNMER